jgi:hypothetical protein
LPSTRRDPHSPHKSRSRHDEVGRLTIGGKRAATYPVRGSAKQRELRTQCG